MAVSKMHDNEVNIDKSLVLRLISDQFPQFNKLPIEKVLSAGTDNALYRLGSDMVVRMPRIDEATSQVDREHTWLPRIAPFLPLAIPQPIAKGIPGGGYPWHWSIYRWLEGENATIENITDPHQTAKKLSQFIASLQQIDTSDGPPPGFGRGGPLILRDHATRDAIKKLSGTYDTDILYAAWEKVLQLPEWSGHPVWIHGDIHAGNLLSQQGKLSAVIDFGAIGVGDPAGDLIVAWNFFSSFTRATFRSALQIDETTWKRGRGWALSIGLIALPYYQCTNPMLAKTSRYTIDEILADFNRSG